MRRPRFESHLDAAVCGRAMKNKRGCHQTTGAGVVENRFKVINLVIYDTLCGVNPFWEECI